ncbi:MAG: PBSX family phage terminase large subunit [Nanoarchaeota archaeon]|nr:PBSX family phage terminase large subunit [Nanoarchaeota archaeon]
MKLFNKQKVSILKSNKRINIWEGSVSSGKTIASIVRWIQYIGNAPTGNLIMTGKTDRALRRNVIDIMQLLIGNDMQYFSGKGEIDLWGRKIFTYGANDERAEGKIRGLTAAGSYCDEITLYPESFWKMLLSRNRVGGAKIFGTTNTDNPLHWLKVDFLDRIKELSLASFHFGLEDNIFLPADYIENIKKEYTGLWFMRFILGLWVAAEGAIYDFFDEDIHTIKQAPEADYYVVGVDYGTQNPCVFLLFGVKNRPTHGQPKIWCEKEYYYHGKKAQKQKTDSQYARDFKNFLGDIKPRAIYIDPSATSFIAQLKSKSIFNIKTADNDVDNGLRLQATMLQKRSYKICQSCPMTIKEYYGYIWDQKASLRGLDKPKKENDHTKDAERYALYTKFGGKVLDYTKLLTL